MHPIEQLRYVARAGALDASALALEAAEALAALAAEPRALVPACRRLLEFHPRVGPLWWVCAAVLGATDPAAAAEEAANLLVEDPTADELAGALPAGSSIVGDCSTPVVSALAGRPDLDARLVGTALELRGALREIGQGAQGGAEVVGFSPDEVATAARGATLAVIGAEAAGPAGALVAPPAAALAAASAAAAVPLWVVCGVGRVLPGALFDALVARLDAAAIVPSGAWRRCVGPDGLAEPAVALRAAGSFAPPELLYRPGV